MAQFSAQVRDGGDLPWADSTSLSSDEGSGGNLAPSPLSAEDTNWMGTASTTPFQTGQLSPVSTSMDATMEMNMDDSSISTIVPSVGSSLNESGTNGMEEQMENASFEDTWDQDTDDILKMPKLEPPEDELSLDLVAATPDGGGPATQTDSSTPELKQKRPRGRPRKHPITPVAVASKITKGRSKTGCITCRKRKKKCDEAKPRCK